MKHNSLVRGLIAFIALVLLAGCGGGGGTAPPSHAGEFFTGKVILEKDRGGGPSIEIGATTVYPSDGHFRAEVVFFYPANTTNSTVGEMVGSISADGLITATVDLSDGDQISIGGGPLRWHSNRGGGSGPSRILSGPVAATYRPTFGTEYIIIRYLGSTFELWQE